MTNLKFFQQLLEHVARHQSPARLLIIGTAVTGSPASVLGSLQSTAEKLGG